MVFIEKETVKEDDLELYKKSILSCIRLLITIKKS